MVCNQCSEVPKNYLRFYGTVLIGSSGLLGTRGFKMSADNSKFHIIENIIENNTTADTSINEQEKCCESSFLKYT